MEFVKASSPQSLTETAALAAFANPARARILDALSASGPATASILAEQLGVAVGSASHHLKVLADAGLVEEAEGHSSDRRQRWWRLTHRQTRWSRAEMTDPTARAAAYEAELVALQRQFDRARESILASDGVETATGAFSTQNWLTLSGEELTALSEELVAVLQRWHQREIPADGAERQTCFVFARGFHATP